jgi:hypothetical protein
MEVAVALNEVGDQGPVLSNGRLDVELLKAAEERCLDCPVDPLTDEVTDFGNNHRRDYQLEIESLQNVEAALMMRVSNVDRRE